MWTDEILFFTKLHQHQMWFLSINEILDHGCRDLLPWGQALPLNDGMWLAPLIQPKGVQSGSGAGFVQAGPDLSVNHLCLDLTKFDIFVIKPCM